MESVDLAAGGYLPDAHGLVLAAAPGSEGLAVSREAQAPDHIRMPLQHADLFTRRRVPQVNGIVGRAGIRDSRRGEGPPVCREGDTMDRQLCPKPEVTKLLPRRSIPDSYPAAALT